MRIYFATLPLCHFATFSKRSIIGGGIGQLLDVAQVAEATTNRRNQEQRSQGASEVVVRRAAAVDVRVRRRGGGHAK